MNKNKIMKIIFFGLEVVMAIIIPLIFSLSLYNEVYNKYFCEEKDLCYTIVIFLLGIYLTIKMKILETNNIKLKIRELIVFGLSVILNILFLLISFLNPLDDLKNCLILLNAAICFNFVVLLRNIFLVFKIYIGDIRSLSSKKNTIEESGDDWMGDSIKNNFNEYIRNYVENDITHSAIMLSAPWGTGKSYYIHNSLTPYLKQNCNIDVIVVSLYGINRIQDISKSIFFECKLKNKKDKKHKIFNCFKKPSFLAAKMLGKTVVKGIASNLNIPLDINENDLQKIYESINLQGKLIIFEDVERTNLDIIDLLGYINGLVDEDGIKVLLVSYDKELKQKCENDGKFDEYNRVKEKTISDTINYYCDYKESVTSIVDMYKDSKLSKIIDADTIDEIVDYVMNYSDIKCNNLRSFIYAYQKTNDIISKIDDVELDKSFCKNLFLGNVAFCLRKKNKDDLQWEEEYDDVSSQNLGTYRFPLYKFSYDYIMSQNINLDDVRKTNDEFVKYNEKVNKRASLDNDFNNIYNFLQSDEHSLMKSIKNINSSLKNKNIIPQVEYTKLANYLIAIKEVLSNIKVDKIVDSCKKLMLDDVTKNNQLVKNQILFHNGIQLETKKAIDEFNDFKKEMVSKTHNKQYDFTNYYSLEKLDEFVNYIYSIKDKLITNKAFAKLLEIDKLVCMIDKANSYQVERIRELFHTVYSFSNLNEFFKNDLENLNLLKEEVNKLIKESHYDKVKNKQLEYLISNLNGFIDSISK